MASPKILFEQLAAHTWERLKLSWEYGISQGEETITDLLQLEVARCGSPRIYVVKTTKAHEAQSGIDWEWWIGDDFSGWLRFAIQAKKIGASGRYHALKHQVKLPGRRKQYQHNLLKRYAKEKGAVPLYCLFNHVRSAKVDARRHWHCSASFEPEQLGCTLAPVEKIDEALRKRGCRTFDFIHRHWSTFPWRCLFCPQCDGFPFLLRTSTFTTGRPPRLYRRLPPSLAFAKDTDRVLGSEIEDDATETFGNNFPVLPRRIMLIETNLFDISNEIIDMTILD